MNSNIKYLYSVIEDKKKQYTDEIKENIDNLSNIRELKNYLEKYTKNIINRKFYALYSLIEQRTNWEYIKYEVKKEERAYISNPYYIYIGRNCILPIESRDRIGILERVAQEEERLVNIIEQEENTIKKLDSIDVVLLDETIETFKKNIPEVLFYEVKKYL